MGLRPLLLVPSGKGHPLRLLVPSGRDLPPLLPQLNARGLQHPRPARLPNVLPHRARARRLPNVLPHLLLLD
jgi:hypothetical protein